MSTLFKIKKDNYAIIFPLLNLSELMLLDINPVYVFAELSDTCSV